MKENPAFSMVNDSDEDVVYGSDEDGRKPLTINLTSKDDDSDWTCIHEPQAPKSPHSSDEYAVYSFLCQLYFQRNTQAKIWLCTDAFYHRVLYSAFSYEKKHIQIKSCRIIIDLFRYGF